MHEKDQRTINAKVKLIFKLFLWFNEKFIEDKNALIEEF